MPRLKVDFNLDGDYYDFRVIKKMFTLLKSEVAKIKNAIVNRMSMEINFQLDFVRMSKKSF